MAKLDPNILAHLEWLGFVQPTGLVVSAPALVRAGAILDRNDSTGQDLLRSCLDPESADDAPAITDFEAFARTVLGWTFSDKGFAGTADNPIPAELHIALPDYGETLVPTYAVRELNPDKDQSPWQLLVTVLEQGTDLDAVTANPGGLEASPHGRMERLLRETGVAAGLLSNGRSLRIISAPRGESSGWLQFEIGAMVQTAGRPICSAMRLLLRQQRLLVLPKEKRLAALLEDSRKFQNEVSENLSEQVLHSLYELLRGFQAAHEASGNALLRDPLADDPDDVYRALLTVILRLVFLLYAEERQMLPTEDETFSRYYSLAGLFSRLRDHAGYFPDTMDQRYGAWAQLTVLFRMVHDGADAGNVKLPPRNASLFDPDRYPFLEGRGAAGARQITDRIEPPRVSDGTIYRVLEKLLVLDGERLSYRALDVEQIGSVYQTMMGFRLETMIGRSLSLKPKQRMGAPTAIDLDELLEIATSQRGKELKKKADRDIPAGVQGQVRDAETVDQLHSALGPIVDRNASPDLQPAGSMVLQPSDERRRSGSHYTPRALTEPIVRTTLRPVLEALVPEGGTPTAEQILELKVCDPAMGSAAFLVEACRQLGDCLIEAWGVHGDRPEIPTDEDEVIFARRLVVQRCIYGVDRNEIAVDLAKMSLWLATLAREHPLTFVDHALRHGDALVGLSKQQIQAFHWDAAKPPLAPVRIAEHLERVAELRELIRLAGEDVSDFDLRDMWDEADNELQKARRFGDLAVLAFFSSAKRKEQEAKRDEFASRLAGIESAGFSGLMDEARSADRPLVPFHWDIEFPEVFVRTRSGFDAIVGNPPFAGKNTITSANPENYLRWLSEAFEDSHGNSDLVAYFFRRSFTLLRRHGTLGLIATNTISEGDTRSTGLRWIAENDGTIYSSSRRVRWPGVAAVVVSVVHILKGAFHGPRLLDGAEVPVITAFLFHRGGNDAPKMLRANSDQSFQGNIILGMGFTFDDQDRKGVANPISEMSRLVRSDPQNGEVIFPYIGGEEVSSSPTHDNHRFVINFDARDEATCRKTWPDLMEVVESKVRPGREAQKDPAAKARWWQFARRGPGLREAIGEMQRVLVTNCGATPHFAISFQPADRVFANSLAIFTVDSFSAFSALQSRPHEVWARFLGSSMKDDLRYTPSDCFETFPFPVDWQINPQFEKTGKAYYDFRAQLMIAHDEGLTKTYNRFHDPEESSPEIAKLRKLHSEMDRAILDSYGWSDISTDCEFILDYGVDDDDSGRKKPWRYRWPVEVHDEVLARLLELNAARAIEESGADLATQQLATKGAETNKMAAQSESLF